MSEPSAPLPMETAAAESDGAAATPAPPKPFATGGTAALPLPEPEPAAPPNEASVLNAVQFLTHPKVAAGFVRRSSHRAPRAAHTC